MQDVRLEEMADAKELKLGKIQEELHILKFKLQDMEEQQGKLVKAIEAKKVEIELTATREEGEEQLDADNAPIKSLSELTRVTIPCPFQ